MSEEPPPWARPRENAERPYASRRVPQEEPEARRPERPPTVVTAPPAPAGAVPPQPAVRQDPHIGLITGPVGYTRVVDPNRTGIGVVAVAMSAVFALVAVVATALAGRTGLAHLLIGTVVPVACVAAVAWANRLAVRRGLGSECRFVLRAETGRSVTWTLRDAGPTDVPHTGDLVRVVPGSGRAARAVEVLAGPDGPVVRRLIGRTRLAPVQWAGLALAAALLVLTTAVLFGAL